jgi:hypothetical protein
MLGEPDRRLQGHRNDAVPFFLNLAAPSHAPLLTPVSLVSLCPAIEKESRLPASS